MYKLKKENLSSPNGIIEVKAAKDKLGIKVDGHSLQEGTPTPSNPVAIESIGDIEINQYGKNYFIVNNMPNTLGIEISRSGKFFKLPIKQNGNGYIDTGITLKDFCPNLQIGSEVTLRFDRISGGTATVDAIYADVAWQNGVTRTVTETMLNSYVAFYGTNIAAGDTEQVILSDFSIMLSNELDTKWEKGFYNTYILPLSEPLRSLPNGVCDTIEEDGVHRRVGKWIVDLDSIKRLDNGNIVGYNANMGTNSKKVSTATNNVMSNKATVNTTFLEDTCYEENNYISFVGNTGSSLDDLKEKFDGSELLYELAEETIEPFTDEQQEIINSIRTEEGINIFDINADTNITLNYTPQITDKIKEAFKHNITRAYLEVNATGEQSGFQINEDNYLQSLDFDDCRYIEGEGIIGSCVAKEIQGKFINVDSSFSVENREIETFLGTEVVEGISVVYATTENEEIDYGKDYYILNEDGTYSEVENPVIEDISKYYERNVVRDKSEYYLRLGTFIVQKPENDNVNDNTSFTALDYMVKFNVPYVYRMAKYIKTADTKIDTNKTYYQLLDNQYYEVTVPKEEDLSTYYELDEKYTILELLQDICKQASVKLGTTKFRNCDYVVEGNRFDDGVTCRDVLKAIAQVAFSWARINEDNELLLDFETSDIITDEIDNDEYYNLSFNEKYGPINTIVLRDSQVEGENITLEDDTVEIVEAKELVIADNPFAYSENTRKELIQAGKALFGFEYIPLSVDTIGTAYLNCEDKLRVKNMQYDQESSPNEYYDTYIFDTKFSYSGALKSSVETLAMTDVETQYKYDGSLTTAQRRTELRVNKAEQEITALIQSGTEQSGKINSIEITVDGMKETITNTTDKLEDRVATLETSVDGLITDRTVSGGQNLIRNSVGYWGSDFWLIADGDKEKEGRVIQNTTTDVKQNSISGSALELQSETIYQEINEVKNGNYYLSFNYKRIIDTAIATLKINDKTINLTENNWQEVQKPFEVTSNSIKIELTTDINSSILITDLMLSEGTLQVSWTQNANESYTDTVQIGKGIKITATNSKTEFSAETDGIRIKNTENNEVVAEFTNTGLETQELVAHKTVKIADSLLIQKIGKQTWFSSLSEI